jgi:hypothetical protein
MKFGLPVIVLVAKKHYVENGVGTITYVGVEELPLFHIPKIQGDNY